MSTRKRGAGGGVPKKKTSYLGLRRIVRVEEAKKAYGRNVHICRGSRKTEREGEKHVADKGWPTCLE